MSVNLEVKGSLAKCLATENLIIEHKQVPTASFDVDRRVLVLPTWDKASPIVYDLLVGHEVGHALFTDNIDWTIGYPEVPMDFVNVLEDVRVERLMKQKYPGLSRTFYNGYNELNTEDFFSTNEENLDELSFIDRINLYYKIGAFHNIAFSDEENEFLTRAIQTESFVDVLNLSREIVEYVKYKKKEQLADIPFPPGTSGESNSEGEEGDEQSEETTSSTESNQEETTSSTESNQEESGSSQSQSQSDDSDSENESSDVTSKETAGGGGVPSRSHNDELKSTTSRSFDEKAQELVNRHANDTYYVELPKWNLNNLIIPNDYIHQTATSYYNIDNSFVNEYFEFACHEYSKYKKSAEKEVSYLVKEFECKKSADQYARSSVARTGVIDTSKLHTYKYNEDLFKKVSVIPDGKNHGLIFVLDWSGSMGNFLLDAYKQLLNLIWFCRKVNIPFEVYAFTMDPASYINHQKDHLPTYEKVAGVIAPEDSFHLMNYFTSTTNNRVLEEQLKNIWAVAYSYQYHRGYVPPHLELSGTPLGETLMSMHEIIPMFQKKNKLQKVNVVLLTDGEGYQNAVTVERTSYRDPDHKYIGFTRKNRTSIRDKKTGRVYTPFGYDNFPEYAKTLLKTLKDKFSTVNFVNFRITPSRDFRTCFNWYGFGNGNGSYEQVSAIYRKQQCVQFKETGFDQFNVIASSALSQDEEFNVPEDATKAQIKSAFTKMLKKKKTNKKMLGSFVELIA
mgnify:CR=1 FL=1